MVARVVSALILAPAALALVAFAPPWLLLIAVGIVGSLCLHEYAGLAAAMEMRGRPLLAQASFWLLLTGFWYKWLPAPALLSIALIGAFLAAMWRRTPVRERAQGLLGDTLGVLYVTVCLYPVLPLRFDFGNRTGLEWLITLFAVTWAGDIAAMFAGGKLGRTRFAPVLSPKKTNEGAVAGLAAGVLAAAVLQRFVFPALPQIHVIAVASLAGVFGQLGDLAESLLKRAAAVKDSSRLIPGHGGVLDRIDSLLFGFPVLYSYLVFLYGAGS